MHTVIFQSAKLGDIPQILAEFDLAVELLPQGTTIQRVYGVSAGAASYLMPFSARGVRMRLLCRSQAEPRQPTAKR